MKPSVARVSRAAGVSVGAALLVAAMDKNGESYLKEIGTLEDKEPEVVKFKVNVQARTGARMIILCRVMFFNNFQDIAEFPASLWCLFFICVAFYISIFVFIQNGSLFLSSKCVSLSKLSPLLCFSNIIFTGMASATCSLPKVPS